MIRAIDERSVDQITSGQVVTSLASAMKELVENALDADATVVEVHIQNHGRDGFSVQDNGSGIAPDDFPNVARRHATSKLSSLSDLAAVRTLGFRGEALASLCALADVRITTSTGSGPGFELDFDARGNVASQKKVVRPKGTAVFVSNMFRTVPVRRRDFERNYQRELTKAVVLLQEYALLSPVRLTVEQNVKNRHSTTLRSQGTKLIQRIACVYGASRTTKLMEINMAPADLGIECTVTGYISKPVFGMGLSSSDRQLIAVNGRPSRQPKLVRTIVEVYKQFNLTESPFFVFDFQMDPARYDVNVSPDKRALLLHHETELINGLRDALTSALNGSGHSVPRSTLSIPPSKRQRGSAQLFAAFAGSGALIAQDTHDDNVEYSEEESALNEPAQIEPAQSVPAQSMPVPSDSESAESPISGEVQDEATLQSNISEEFGEASSKAEQSIPETNLQARSSKDAVADDPVPQLSEDLMELSYASPEADHVAGLVAEFETEVHQDEIDHSDANYRGEDLVEVPEEEHDEELGPGHGDEPENSDECSCEPCGAGPYDAPTSESEADRSLGSSTETREPSRSEVRSDFQDQAPTGFASMPNAARSGHIKHESEDSPSSPSLDEPRLRVRTGPTRSIDLTQRTVTETTLASRLRPPSQPRSLNHHIHLPVSLADIEKARKEVGSGPQDMKHLRKLAIDEEGAEERLSLDIRKQDFSKMEVVGQFNLGFIVVVHRKKNHDDLFVIDQHASDEIYNFERLQRSTVLSRQPLVAAHTLELSAVEELTVAENLGVFENNGFTITVNPANPPGKQCALLSVPFSKNTVFDEKDVHDLLSKILEDPENKQVRCSKLRAMLAMRACRSSIMIGKPLSVSMMKQVVQNLGTLDKPWNCPHGRPTLRHITTLS